VYIFYSFDSCGDISEETKDAGRLVPRAMRLTLICGGVASLILTGALLLSMPEANPVGATVDGGGSRSSSASSPAACRTSCCS
jgi:amino acid transporter